MSTYRPFLLIVAILLAGLLTTPVPAAPPKKPTPSSARPQPGVLRPQSLAANEYLPTSKLKAGMKGYGLTVFKGAKIERFEVTVLGVLKKANNGKDLILVRMKGGPLTKRYATVVSGMSGSPVYVNGRIIGAYAYAPEFLREPLGLPHPHRGYAGGVGPRPAAVPDDHAANGFFCRARLRGADSADGHHHRRKQVRRVRLPRRASGHRAPAIPCAKTAC